VVDVVEHGVSVKVVVVEVGGKVEARSVEVVVVVGLVSVEWFWFRSVGEATTSLWVPVVWATGGKVGRELLVVTVGTVSAVDGGEDEDEDAEGGEEALVTGMVT
jgi:hypothetical protein